MVSMTSWMPASMAAAGRTGPCLGRNCGKKENAKMAAFGLAAMVSSEARNAAAGVRAVRQRLLVSS